VSRTAERQVSFADWELMRQGLRSSRCCRPFPIFSTTAHVALQLMDRRCLRSPHDVEGNGLMRVATKAFHFEIAEPGVDRVTQRGRWLRRTLKAEHALVPRLDREPVRLDHLLDTIVIFPLNPRMSTGERVDV
jgi:hypothetical protein